MRVTRGGRASGMDGAARGVRIVFSEVETQTMAGLLDDLVDQLGPDGLRPGDPVHDRLYPSGYSGAAADEAAQQEFRELTHSGLREERIARAQACRAELVAPVDRRGRVEVVLDAPGCARWLRVLNDLRLAIGTRLGITEERDGGADLDMTDPQAMSYLVYGWLSEAQDGLVRVAMN